jgi:hypothetical protein
MDQDVGTPLDDPFAHKPDDVGVLELAQDPEFGKE